MDKKDIVFYSNYCTYCKKILTHISKLPIKDKLLYVCVDDSKIQLPQFVKAVPTIYLAEKKQIVVDESIEKWLESLHSKPKNENISNNELDAYYGNGDVNVLMQKTNYKIEELKNNNSLRWKKMELKFHKTVLANLHVLLNLPKKTIKYLIR